MKHVSAKLWKTKESAGSSSRFFVGFFFKLFRTQDRPSNKLQTLLFVHARHDTGHGNWQGVMGRDVYRTGTFWHRLLIGLVPGYR